MAEPAPKQHPNDGETTEEVKERRNLEDDAARERRDANTYLSYGAGIGAIGVIGGVVGAAVCPVCVVATPALLGAGIYKRLKARRIARTSQEGLDPVSAE